MKNLFTQRLVLEITLWSNNGRSTKLSVRQWALLLALVMIDQEKSHAILNSSTIDDFVLNLRKLKWYQPFTTTTHREGQSGLERLYEYLRSDKISYAQKQRFADGYNYLMRFCYEEIIMGHTRFNWLLSRLITFTWGTKLSICPEIAEKILLDSRVDNWSRTALSDYYSKNNNVMLPVHLQLNHGAILKIKDLVQNDPDLKLMHKRINSIRPY